MTPSLTILQGDCLAQLRTLPDASVQCCVTSPPYWGLRDYGVNGQLGLERTPEEYVAKMVEVFAEVRRVLRDDGTCWINLGDSYASGTGGNRKEGAMGRQLKGRARPQVESLKPKNLVGIPWRVAFALQADGWYLRSEITWCKKVPMPESVRDRPTSATEKIFLLAKSDRYFYDADAVRNPPSDAFLNDPRWQTGSRPENEKNGYETSGAQNPKKLHKMFDRPQMASGSNMRNYWVLGPEPYSDAHFATFPQLVPRKCILAGTKPGDVVLDPFAGSGTTGAVALELGRGALLVELNPAYVELIRQRCRVTPGLPLAC